jgi:hypothetical protein
MTFPMFRRPLAALAAAGLAVVAAGPCVQAGGLFHHRAVLVPVSDAQVTREVVREVVPAETRTVVVREIVREVPAPAPEPAPAPQKKEPEPTPQAPAASKEAAPATERVVVRYVVRDVAPTTVVRTVRVVPVERVVVREVASPTYVVVKPKHHLFGW